MKKVVINDKEYELLDDYNNGFDLDIVKEKMTDYFDDFDYIVGDWAYNKLRLKGFYEKNNPKCSKINNIEKLQDYLKNNCAYGCKWFKLKKEIENK